MSRRTERGAAAERAARAWLEQRGLRLRHANYRCRWGEIDLVMEDGDTLVFVEVRYRNDPRYGGAAASVDATKQQRLARAAAHYLSRLRGQPPASRFDVVALEPGGRIEWITDAFESGD